MGNIDFKKWNEEFGGKKAVQAVKEAKENQFTELPEGTYVCALEKLELVESSAHKPMVKAMFRIKEGQHKKQCLFYNGVMSANNPEYNGFVIHNVLSFLRSLDVLDESDIDFNGDFADFNDLIMDIAEESQGLKYEIETEKDGNYTRLNVVDVFE